MYDESLSVKIAGSLAAKNDENMGNVVKILFSLINNIRGKYQQRRII